MDQLISKKLKKIISPSTKNLITLAGKRTCRGSLIYLIKSLFFVKSPARLYLKLRLTYAFSFSLSNQWNMVYFFVNFSVKSHSLVYTTQEYQNYYTKINAPVLTNTKKLNFDLEKKAFKKGGNFLK